MFCSKRRGEYKNKHFGNIPKKMGTFPKIIIHKKSFCFIFLLHFYASNKKTTAMLKNFHRLFSFTFTLIVLTAFGVNAVAQTVTVTGTVTGNNNEPLSGVTVTDKQSNNAVVSSADGQFSIKASSSTSALVFSYTGFQTVELPLNGQT